MFNNCKNLKYLDLYSFNVKNFIYKNDIFNNCNKLLTIKFNKKNCEIIMKELNSNVMNTFIHEFSDFTKPSDKYISH